MSVVRENYRQERIFIAYYPRDQVFELLMLPSNVTQSLSRISVSFVKGYPRNRFVKDYFQKLRLSREVSDKEEDQITENIDRLYDLHDYPFTALELSASVNEEEVADVFVRINSKGTILNQADFILTLMSVFWDEGRATIRGIYAGFHANRLSTGPSPFNYYIHPDPDQLIRVDMGVGFDRARLRHVYSILRGKDLETGQFSVKRRDAQFAILQKAQEKVSGFTELA